MQFSFDTNLNRIAEKVEAGDRLTFEEGIDLYKTEDLNALGKLLRPATIRFANNCWIRFPSQEP